MKTNPILLLVLLVLFASCEKVIDVDLNKATPQIVIEANLLEGTHNFKVRVSQTSSYFDNQASPAIINAHVILHDSSNTMELQNSGNGYYQLENYTAVSNANYILTVTVDGNSYNATSFMPPAVELDSLIYEYVPNADVSQSGYRVMCSWKDPINVTNYYRLISSKNNVAELKSNNLIALEDRLSDGLSVTVPLYSTIYQENDTVKVSLLSIDKNGYDYFNTLSQVAMNNNGTAPANPNTNFTGGALGYFVAASSSDKTIIIK